jgi:hypothetical protein
VPSGEVVAFTNPNGPDWSNQPPDTYPVIEKAQELPTYANLWFDQNQVDLHIAVTDDIDGAIAKLGQYVPRGVTVYFQLAPFTDAQLCALRDSIFNDRDKLMKLGIVLMTGGCEDIQMRVEIGLSPLTPETLSYMQSHYPGPVDFESDGEAIPLGDSSPPGGDVTLSAITPEEQATLMTCGQRPFTESALSQPPIDVSTAGDAYGALRDAFDAYSQIFGDLSALPWVLAESDEYGATFLTPRDNGYLEEMVVEGNSGGWFPTTLSECQPASYSINAGSANWALDPAFPAPDANTQRLHVLVVEMACAGSRQPIGRILPPLATYTDASVTLTVAVRSVGGPATCPGNPALPVTIVLPQPLGDRTLTGGTDPDQLR